MMWEALLFPGDDTFRMLHEIYDEGLCPLRYRHQACIQSLEEFRECVGNGEFKHGVYKDRRGWLWDR